MCQAHTNCTSVKVEKHYCHYKVKYLALSAIGEPALEVQMRETEYQVFLFPKNN